MISKTKYKRSMTDLKKKVNDYLTNDTSGGSKCKEIAANLKISVSKVYQIIRKLREDGVGIIPGKKGYVKAEFATKIDDLQFMRKIYGRRVSDFLALSTSKPHIEKRWNALPNGKKKLQSLLAPLSEDIVNSVGFKNLQIEFENEGLKI